MPLIGIYRGRDRSDNVFRQEFALTNLPLGMVTGGPVPFSSSLVTRVLPLTIPPLTPMVFGAQSDSTTLPLTIPPLTPMVFGAQSDSTTLPLTMTNV